MGLKPPRRTCEEASINAAQEMCVDRQTVSVGLRVDEWRDPVYLGSERRALFSLVVGPSQSLHDLVLGQTAMGIGIHHVTSAGSDVLDEAEAKGSAAVLVALEFGDRGFGSVGAVEPNNTRTARSTARLVLDLGLLDLTDG